MACMWIERFNESPPMEFERLLVQITDEALLDTINDLLVKKKAGFEFGVEPKIPIINEFIETVLTHFEKIVKAFDPKKKPDQVLLEEGFVKILDHVSFQL